jgi:hypothetical protein
MRAREVGALGGTRIGRALVVALLAVAVSAAGTAGVGATTVAARRGASCLPGSWKLDLQRLVSEASTTQTLTATGAVDLRFRRHQFLQTYSDIITGESASPSGGTIKVEQKYAGAVAGDYSTPHAGELDLTNIDNATEMVITTSVNGISAQPNRQAPAPGTTSGSVTLDYTCRGNNLRISSGGAVAQHYTRVS